MLPQHVSLYNSMELRAANSAVHARIWLKLELIRDAMAVLVTYKNKEGPIKNKGARVVIKFPMGATCIGCDGNQSSNTD